MQHQRAWVVAGIGEAVQGSMSTRRRGATLLQLPWPRDPAAAFECDIPSHLHEPHGQVLQDDAVRGRKEGEDVLDEVALVLVEALPVLYVRRQIHLLRCKRAGAGEGVSGGAPRGFERYGAAADDTLCVALPTRIASAGRRNR